MQILRTVGLLTVLIMSLGASAEPHPLSPREVCDTFFSAIRAEKLDEALRHVPKKEHSGFKEHWPHLVKEFKSIKAITFLGTKNRTDKRIEVLYRFDDKEDDAELILKNGRWVIESL
jgi:hypothetical protein